MKLTISVILAIIVASSGAAFGADGERYGLSTAPPATAKTAAAIPRWEKSSV